MSGMPLRKCFYASEYGGWRLGYFHRWTDVDEKDYVTGTKTRAIVEGIENGHVEIVPVNMISFVEN